MFVIVCFSFCDDRLIKSKSCASIYAYNGEGEDSDQEDSQRGGQAGDLLEAAAGPLQEGRGTLCPL